MHVFTIKKKKNWVARLHVFILLYDIHSITQMPPMDSNQRLMLQEVSQLEQQQQKTKLDDVVK